MPVLEFGEEVVKKLPYLTSAGKIFFDFAPISEILDPMASPEKPNDAHEFHFPLSILAILSLRDRLQRQRPR